MANLDLGAGDKGCTTYLTGLSFDLWKMANQDLGAGDKGCTTRGIWKVLSMAS